MQRQSMFKTLRYCSGGRTNLLAETAAGNGSQKKSTRQFGSNSGFSSSGDAAANPQKNNGSDLKSTTSRPAFGGGWGKPTFGAKVSSFTEEELKQRQVLLSQQQQRQRQQQQQQQEPWQERQKQQQEPGRGPRLRKITANLPPHASPSGPPREAASIPQDRPIIRPAKPQIRRVIHKSVSEREEEFHRNPPNSLRFPGFRNVPNSALPPSPPRQSIAVDFENKKRQPEAEFSQKGTVRQEPPQSTRHHEFGYQESTVGQSNESKPSKKQRRRREQATQGTQEGDVAGSKTFSPRYSEDFDDVDDFDRPRQRRKQGKKKKGPHVRVEENVPTAIYLPDFISVGNLADALSVRQNTFLRRLQSMGFDDVTHDHVLDAETAGLIAAEFNFDPIFDIEADDLVPAPAPTDTSNLPLRPPVVTIMGHVDHGKTTILDWLRKASVAASEHGGITQHIGAFSVSMPSGKQITFLDTPGHSAFLEMRKRGADVTDIVVLVVAADDSVKPQTIEAIKHAKQSNVPIIVAISKIDKDGVDIERVKQDLARHNVNVEDYGGDVQAIGVSGKTGQGMLELEEAAVTLSEMLDLRADKDGDVEGWVIEAATKKGGRVATVLVRRGTLRPGDIIVAGSVWAKIRSLRNEAGVLIDEVLPGMPVEVDGWREQPTAGSEVLQAPNEQRAKDVVSMRLEKEDTKKTGGDMAAINEIRRLERVKRDQEAAAKEMLANGEDQALGDSAASGGPNGIPFLVKADVSGSIEAIVNSVSSLGNNEVFAKVLRSGVGKIGEFDVKHAAVANAHIISFNQTIDPEMYRLATVEGVRILDHRIIYELIDDVKAKLSEHLPPTITQRVSGEADIGEIFNITVKGRQVTSIAGCKVRNGLISRSHKVRVLRNKEVIYDGTFSSLKNLKKDVTEARKGTECGMAFQDWSDFATGDSVQTYEEVSEKRFL